MESVKSVRTKVIRLFSLPIGLVSSLRAFPRMTTSPISPIISLMGITSPSKFLPYITDGSFGSLRYLVFPFSYVDFLEFLSFALLLFFPSADPPPLPEVLLALALGLIPPGLVPAATIPPGTAPPTAIPPGPAPSATMPPGTAPLATMLPGPVPPATKSLGYSPL